MRTSFSWESCGEKTIWKRWRRWKNSMNMCVKGIVLEDLDRILVARDKDQWTQEWIVRFRKISCWKLAYLEGPFYFEFVCFLVNIDCSGIGHKQGVRWFSQLVCKDVNALSVSFSICRWPVGVHVVRYAYRTHEKEELTSFRTLRIVSAVKLSQD
jgi:hypothetical protein